MPASPAIRLALPADGPGIARMSRTCIEHGLSWSWTETRVMQSVQDASTNVAVATAHNRLQGFGIMHYRDDDAHLVLLAVAPALRRQGLGRQLLAWLERPAVAAGIGVVRLECRADNPAAIAFYLCLGYRRAACVPGYYEGVIDAVRMHKRLRPAPA